MSNPNDSKPLGARNYLKQRSGNVTIPDGLLINNVNLYLSILFYKHSYLKFPGGSPILVNGFGPNCTSIDVTTDRSYWAFYLIHILKVMNFTKEGNTNTGNFNKKSKTNDSKSSFQSRSFSTANVDRRLTNEMFSDPDELTL